MTFALLALASKVSPAYNDRFTCNHRFTCNGRFTD